MGRPRSSSNKKKLFDDDDEEESEESSLRVNNKFAASLQESESKRLRMKEAALGLGSDDSGSSSDEDEDEDGEELTPELDLKIVKTINAIRRKDQAVYDGATNFFSTESSDSEESKDASEKKKKKTYKDTMREQLLASHSEEEAKDKGFAYDEEQRNLRAEIKKELEDEESRSDEEDDDDDKILFVKPKKKALESTAIEEALREELETFEELSSETKKDDAFLADFVAKQKWKAPVAPLDDSESDVDEMENFEASYNFRFEQKGATTVATHARDATSMRKEVNARSVKRQKKKQDLDLLEVQKLAELQRLKHEKRKELSKKMALLREAAGAEVDLEEDDDDFDPEKHDQRMAKAFDESYYEDQDHLFKELQLDHDAEEALAKLELRGKIIDLDDDVNSAKSDDDEPKKKKKSAFRYMSVPADDFGLSTEDILETEDKDLNQLVTLKKIAPYSDAQYTVSAKKRKNWRHDIAQKKLKETKPKAEKKKRTPDSEEEKRDETNDTTAEAAEEKKKKKPKKDKDTKEAKKRRKGEKDTDEVKAKKTRRKDKTTKDGSSEARLKSYAF